MEAHALSDAFELRDQKRIDLSGALASLDEHERRLAHQRALHELGHRWASAELFHVEHAAGRVR